MSERYLNGEIIDLSTGILVDALNVPLTGLADVTVRVRRKSDGFWLDWSDNTFKNAGWVTLNGAMAEMNAANAAGVYFRSFPTVGFANDQYYIRMQSPSALNSPQDAAAFTVTPDAGATAIAAAVDAQLTTSHGAGSWVQADGAPMSLTAAALAAVGSQLSTIISSSVLNTTLVGAQAIQLQEAWAMLGLNPAAPTSFDFPSKFVKAPANVTPINIVVSVNGTTVTLTRT